MAQLLSDYIHLTQVEFLIKYWWVYLSILCFVTAVIVAKGK